MTLERLAKIEAHIHLVSCRASGVAHDPADTVFHRHPPPLRNLIICTEEAPLLMTYRQKQMG